MKEKEKKYCGECCWFYGEDTYGYGCCPFRFADVHECGQQCDTPTKYVSKAQMRHYQAVLLQSIRWDEDWYYIRYAPDGDEETKAKKFAYEYIKVFSNL